ncbi:MAG TPA: hypothetical protein VJT83_03740 [Chitinophagaceae bacterium]|nr:hypothetical protein [Chitinophagaceae bacterium]
MMIIVQIILLYAFFASLICFIIRNKSIKLTAPQVFLAFGFQVLLGCIHGYIFSKYYPGDDTLFFNQLAAEQHEKLVNSPKEFFSEISLTASFNRNETFADGWHYLLDELQKWMVAKPLALFNFVSRGNYYLNIVFFNFIVFWGPYLLFKLFTSIRPQKKLLFYIAAFFIPSIGFWICSIRSDGLIVLSLAILLYYFQTMRTGNKFNHLISAIVGMIGLIILRDEFLLVLLPALLSWWIVSRFNFKPWKVFATVYAVTIILFFVSGASALVASRQHEFLELQGTRFPLDKLEPDALSFISVFPQAVYNGFLKPFPWEAQGLLQWAMVADIIFFLIMAVFAFAYRKSLPHHPLIWVGLLFGLSTMLLIGYTVPFPGAIVRYKVIPELILYLIFVCSFTLKFSRIYSFSHEIHINTPQVELKYPKIG